MAGPWIGAWPVGVSRGARDYCRASGKLSEISVTVENGLSGMSVATVPEWASVRRMDTSSESWRQVHFPALGCDEEIPVRVLVGGCSVLVRAEHEFVGWRGHFRCGLFWVVEERVGSALFLVEVEGIPGVLGLLWCCGPRAGGGNRSRLVVSAENPSHPERDDRDQDDERNDQAPR